MICRTSLSEIESDVLRRVHYAGALTRRSLIRDYGPYPNWQRLVVDGPLHEVATVYGTVICYSAQGYRWALTAGFADPPSYLQGPSVVADRAYQHDAVHLLQSRGYQVHDCTYKRGRRPGTYTDIVVNLTMRAPADRLVTRTKPSSRYGYPVLYAAVSGGGITPARLRSLLRHHGWDQIGWGHPLLIATPNVTALRPTLRRLAATQPSPIVPAVELLDLPLPQTICRNQ